MKRKGKTKKRKEKDRTPFGNEMVNLVPNGPKESLDFVFTDLN